MNIQRPTWDETFMEMAQVLSKRSTCLRLQTAAVIVKNNVIISVGYNGTTSGSEHCCDYWKRINEISHEFLNSSAFANDHHTWSQLNEHHGEMNAILFAARGGIQLQGSEMYSIYSPCIHCAKSITTAGITRVYYKHIYKRDCTGISFLKKNGIEVIHLSSDHVQ